MDFEQMRIEPAANGIIVHVGGERGMVVSVCTYVFNTTEDFYEWFVQRVNQRATP